MQGLPSVVIIIPVLNGERVLGECLNALNTQTYTGPIQIIVINDGSTDRTSEIAHSFAGVKVIEQENLGRAVARNRGIIAARGKSATVETAG